ncbi:hypothetical protein [Aquimarina megaterium]|uniref:hypothetical protein n=1 Tax=Aquimarina megaterium TaxID=1443666 RepID=UPI00046EFFEC|nr:hypothetical protein [Aquimarina megaterium]
MEIDFTSQILIQELSAWMDGGSVTLHCMNKKKQEFEIEFVQNVNWNILEFEKLPGRIYLNGNLISQRSDMEEKLIGNLETAALINSSDLDETILKEKIDYIKSEQFILDSDKIQIRKR